jgi:hypothetical protein
MSIVTEDAIMAVRSLKARRRRAKRLFVLRFTLVISLMAGITYSAWFARWAHAPRSIPIDIVR